MFQSLSAELLQLKSSSEKYEETNDNLQNVCNLIEKISLTYQELTENLNGFLTEMNKMVVEGKNTRKLIQENYVETKNILQNEIKNQGAQFEEKLLKISNEISDEIQKQSTDLHQQVMKQSKTIKMLKILNLTGISMGVILIILRIISMVQ